MAKQLFIQFKFILLNLSVSGLFGLILFQLVTKINILPDSLTLGKIVNWTLVLVIFNSCVISIYLYRKYIHWLFLINLVPAFLSMLLYLVIAQLFMSAPVVLDCLTFCP